MVILAGPRGSGVTGTMALRPGYNRYRGPSSRLDAGPGAVREWLALVAGTTMRDWQAPSAASRALVPAHAPAGHQASRASIRRALAGDGTRRTAAGTPHKTRSSHTAPRYQHSSTPRVRNHPQPRIRRRRASSAYSVVQIGRASSSNTA